MTVSLVVLTIIMFGGGGYPPETQGSTVANPARPSEALPWARCVCGLTVEERGKVFWVS